jgi:signal peptidase I
MRRAFHSKGMIVWERLRAGTSGAQHPARRRIGTWLRRLLWSLGVGVPVAVALAAVGVLYFSDRVVGPSMLPGLHPGDRVLVNPLAYAGREPRRGDVVALVPPVGPRAAAVKRVVGLPGDELEIRPGTSGLAPVVLVRPGGKGPWERLAEPYATRSGNPNLGCCDGAGRATGSPRPFKIPAGRYFVLGDNRNVSYDSTDYGPVSRDSIQGKVSWLVLPLSRFGPISARLTST